jgi:EAL domain-containing protein (putative c-di-GMP-specific phosphodiesterase class I)/CheY-like chemotaxis protein
MPLTMPISSVLVVEDEEPLRRAYARMLENAGYHSVQAANGQEAIGALATGKFSVVLSDIKMPGMTGTQLLRAARQCDLDLPVILVTGEPAVETAAEAVEYGALRYLIKPVDPQLLLDAVGMATRLHRIAQLKREALAYLGSDDRLVGDRAGLEASFERALATLWMAYQPIVAPADRKVVAFEALVRTREPMLPHPGALFSAAERLGKVHEIGRAIRESVATTLGTSHPKTDVFINLHPRDLLDETLYSEHAPLVPFAESIVFEITERTAIDESAGVAAQIRQLRRCGYRVAIDDLGSGYAGLNYFAMLMPDVVKIDMALIRNIHNEPVKRKIVGSLNVLCRELGMAVVAEGVESNAEREALDELGCGLFQGFLFARPAPPFPQVSW